MNFFVLYAMIKLLKNKIIQLFWFANILIILSVLFNGFYSKFNLILTIICKK